MPTISIKTVKPGGGGDYTSLSAWEAAEQANLVSGDLIKVALCVADGVVDTLQCTLAGWTTDASHYISILGDQPTEPVFSGARYLLRGAPALTTGVLRNLNFGGAGYVFVDRIQVRSRNAACDCIRQNDTAASASWRISRCHLEALGALTANGNFGINIFGGGTHYIWNNSILYFANAAGPPGNPTGGIWIQSAFCNAFVYSNTISSCYTGVNGSLLTRVVNNIVHQSDLDFAGGAFVTGADFHSESGYNAVTEGAPPGINNWVGPITFETFPDFHLSLDDMTARRHGVDLSESVIPFSDDMEGTPRGEVWDIGADQVETEDHGIPDALRVYFEESRRFFRWKGEGQFTSLLAQGGFTEGGEPGEDTGGER